MNHYCHTISIIECFNTTLVPVQHIKFQHRWMRPMGFNTTLVPVQHFPNTIDGVISQVSIQHLFLFNSSVEGARAIHNNVSIQHLFLFNHAYTTFYDLENEVSIQHLFLFNDTRKWRRSLRKQVSIQHLFLFNRDCP